LTLEEEKIVLPVPKYEPWTVQPAAQAAIVTTTLLLAQHTNFMNSPGNRNPSKEE
jgi:hypothetical protein